MSNEEYYRVRAYIHQEALRSNIRTIRRKIGPDTKLMAVVKANAYGHDIGCVWPVLQEEGVDELGVAVLEEGMKLRQMGIQIPILLLGYTAPSDASALIDHQLMATVFTYDMAKAISDEAVRKGVQAKIHIALDTGMSRIGFACTEASVKTILDISALPGVTIEGLFTHFAKADQRDKTPARAQLMKYNRMYDRLCENGLFIPIRHVSNSAGIMELEEAHFEMVRAGIILYGLSPSDEMDTSVFPLKPVMELKSHIIYIKQIQDGDEVSYGGTYKAHGTRTIGTIPIGYADGYYRLLSNQAFVLVRGVRCPVAGRVCMDQMMVDLTDVPDATGGDEVILFGQDPPLDELAELAGTITYELTCSVSSRVPRIPCP